MTRFPASRRRHYELLNDFPDGYLVVGDALCSFNPIHGQGMTVAAFEAEILDSCLSDHHDGSSVAGLSLAKQFYSRVTPLLDAAWATSTGDDLKYPDLEGVRTSQQEQANAFLTKVYQAAAEDAEVSRQIVRVINLLDGPEVLQDPGFVEHVVKTTA